MENDALHHILIVSDAWEPQVNGVVRTLKMTRQELARRGHRVTMLTPNLFRSVPCPTYPEIRLAMTMPRRVGSMIAALQPDAIHIATEGPLGLSARRWCQKNGHPFTTAYHTQFPDYVAARTGLNVAHVWRYMRWFHGPAHAVLTATETLRSELRAQGIHQLAPWGRGVDLSLFSPDAAPHPAFANLPRPILLNVGRVAVEKNLEAFLALDTAGSKVVVGDGPALDRLRQAHPDVIFLGSLSGADLAGAYADADAFVFPSRTDTFGLVMIEAMACGTPVAALPVTGPIDVVTAETGALHDDLNVAIEQALLLDRTIVARHGAMHSWEAATAQFLSALAPLSTVLPERSAA